VVDIILMVAKEVQMHGQYIVKLFPGIFITHLPSVLQELKFWGFFS